MSEFQIIGSAVERVARRRHRERMWQGLWRGLLAGAVSYRAMFIVATVIGVMSWALLRFGVRDPRHINPQNLDAGQSLVLP